MRPAPITENPQGGKVTTARVWKWSLVGALLIGGILGFGFGRLSTRPGLRSEHGEQAVLGIGKRSVV